MFAQHNSLANKSLLGVDFSYEINSNPSFWFEAQGFVRVLDLVQYLVVFLGQIIVARDLFVLEYENI